MLSMCMWGLWSTKTMADRSFTVIVTKKCKQKKATARNVVRLWLHLVHGVHTPTHAVTIVHMMSLFAIF